MGYIESMLLHDEAIIYTGRKHFTMVLGQVLTEVILLSLTGVAMWLVGRVLILYKLTENQFVVYVLYGVLAVAALVLLVSAILDYMRWYNDCVVLTNQRIMKFDGLFNRHMVESSLDKINDVVLNQTIFGRLFGFGDIMIMTAADTGNQEMRNIADPVSFKRALAEARNYDAIMKTRATVEAVEDAVETAIKNAVNDQATPTEHPAVSTPVLVVSDEIDDSLTASKAKMPIASDAIITDQATEPTTHITQRTALLLSYLEALHAAGVLSDEEYDTKRRVLEDDRA